MKSPTDFPTLHPASRIAAALGISKRAVTSTLADTPASGVALVGGRQAAGWAFSDLPQTLQDRLLSEARRRGGYRDVTHLLASPPARWEPPIPLGEIAAQAINRAAQLMRALAPVLARKDDANLLPNDFTRLGLAEYRRVFGHTTSAKHWRALFDRVLQRDGGAEDFDRVELYLEANPPRKAADAFASAMNRLEWRSISERLASFKDAARPTEQELQYLWVDIFDAYDEQKALDKPKRVKRRLLEYLAVNAPFLGASYKAIDLKFTRRLERWRETGGNPEAVADQRAIHSGNWAEFDLPEADRLLLIARAVELAGNIAHAWRGLIGGWKNPQGQGFTAETRAHYTPKGRNKSYVPARVRDLVKHDVTLLLARHQGPRCDKLNGAFINRDPSTFNAGDWMQADDATLEIYFWAEDENGKPRVTRGQWIPMIDCRTLFIFGFVLTATPSYNAFDVRNLMTTVADKWGLPRKGYYYERGLWKRAKLIVGPKAEAVEWDETCMGLRGRLGLQFRHAQLPRGKVIERVLGIIQSHLRDKAGWASNDERRKLPEKLKEQLASIERGEVHPSELLFSHAEWCRELEKVCAAFNIEKQNGKCLPGLSPQEGYEFFGARSRAWIDHCRYLMADEKERVTVGRNGITLRYGKQVFNYKNERTGELQGQQVICWFSPGNPQLLSVTDLDGKNPFIVPRSTAVPGMDADRETLSQALRENAAHNGYRRALYRTISGHFSASFTQRMFRHNLTDRKTAALGQTMRQQTAAFEQDQKKKVHRAGTVKRRMEDLGIPASIIDTASEESDQFSRLMQEAARDNEREQQGTP